MKKNLLSLIFCLCICNAYSRITLPPVLGDNMVLQQQSKVKLWGKSDKKSEVRIVTGWNNKTYFTKVDNQGDWLVEVFTPVAGGSYSITITDGEAITINNILIGDVWYCSGQSNMEMPLKGMTASQPVVGANDAIAAASKMKKMRIYTVAFGAEGKDYSGKWEIVDSSTAANFSAIGYFFGRNLVDALDIPVGMICSAKGGTRIELWSNKTDLDSFSPDELNSATTGNSVLYNLLVKPISQYNIKGFLWYQGESNWESNPVSYGTIFEKMIARWRSDWGQGELPFYFVEVAPMKNLASVELRESQYKVAKTVPSVAMASTIDVGEPECIHPSQKEIVAKRLSHIALAKTYGMSGIRADNPSFRECRVNEDGKIWIEFDHAEFGFFPRNNIDGFEIAGADKVFKPVKADAIYIRELDKNFIQIENTEITNPRYVRYCHLPWVKGSLYNTFDLPVLAFSTEIPTTDYRLNDGSDNNKLMFRNDDRWCAIGNSITHQGKYSEIIYLYYITHYPHQHIELFNCGAGGDTATGTLTRRMDRDILENKPTVATIMLGMNDIWWENSGLFSKDNYSHDLEEIVNRLEKENCRVILITPSPYDYSVKSEEPVDPKRLGLERLAKEVIELGKKRNIPVVDFYNPMLEITWKQQAMDSSFTLLLKDRVHTKPLANFIMGYTFLQATTPATLVSKATIDANYSTVIEQINCSVNNLSSAGGTIQFSSLENALPYPEVAIPEESSAFFDFNNERNKEILQIKGLEQGQYTLYIDSVEIGSFVESEFSKGINLASIAHTPQNKQSGFLAEIVSEYTAIVGGKIRYIAMIEYGELKKRYGIDDVFTAKHDIIKQFGEDNRKFDEYLKLKKAESFWMKNAEELKSQLWLNNKPKTHNYLIKKDK